MTATQQNYLERRKEYRLPYPQRIVFTDGLRSETAYAANISKGGLFVTSLDPHPIETKGFLLFCLPNQKTSFCIQAKVVHIVFDRQRCEIENGMGFQFASLTLKQSEALQHYLRDQQSAYLELKKVLEDKVPSPKEIERFTTKIPGLKNLDLLGLRYRVNRICTIFEPFLSLDQLTAA